MTPNEMSAFVEALDQVIPCISARIFSFTISCFKREQRRATLSRPYILLRVLWLRPHPLTCVPQDGGGSIEIDELSGKWLYAKHTLHSSIPFKLLFSVGHAVNLIVLDAAFWEEYQDK